MSIDIQAIEREAHEWRSRNFPAADASQQLLGVIEEAGELTHHYLKMKQGIRGTEDDHKTEMVDAIGDIQVYLLGYLGFRGISWSRIEPHTRLDDKFDGRLDDPLHLLFRLSNRIGRLANWQDLDNVRGRNGFGDTITRLSGNIVGLLRAFATCYGWDANQILHDTWQSVKERNWIENPTDGQVVSGNFTPLDDLEDAQSQGYSG